MPETTSAARFVVTIPMTDLKDLAASEGLGDDPTREELADALKNVLIAGLEEYLGEAVPVDVKLID